jgi:hypothetical protein
MAKVEELLIFLASPRDVPNERRYVREVVDELNHRLASQQGVVLRVVDWETDTVPGYGQDGQALINAQIAKMEEYALFVGLMWNRLGTPTLRGPSGTVEEFERAVAACKRCGHPDIWFYFRQPRAQLNTPEQREQRDKVVEFRKQIEPNGLLWSYESPSEFQTKFRDHLITWLMRRTRPAGAVTDQDIEKAIAEAATRFSSEVMKDHLDSIHTLQSLARTSEKHGPQILDALAEFVRTSAPWRPGIVNTAIGEDVQSAVTLIGRLPKRRDSGRLYRLEMPNVDLAGANLANADLEGAVLWGSNLCHVVLARANLRGADLGGVDFTDASLEMADLQGAFLWASSPCAPQRPCILDRTRLAGAKLKGTHLEAALLVNAIDLTEAQVGEAIVNDHTRLPVGINISRVR